MCRALLGKSNRKLHREARRDHDRQQEDCCVENVDELSHLSRPRMVNEGLCRGG